MFLSEDDEGISSLRTPLLSITNNDGDDDDDIMDSSPLTLDVPAVASHDEGHLQEPVVAVLDANQSDDENGDRGILRRTLLPEDTWKVRGSILFNRPHTVRLIKFVFLSLSLILWLHWLVSHRQRHRNETFSVRDLLMYQLDCIVRDLIVFFVVGRLWKRPGVDNLYWLLTILLGLLILEYQNLAFPWLQVSISRFDIHCLWNMQTRVYSTFLLLLGSGLVFLHCRWSWKQKLFWMQLGELVALGIAFLSPVVSSPFFQLHSWFLGWFCGMHCRADTWWSELAMIACLCLYIHGIAVYGRTPLLTCEYAYFMSADQPRCPFLDCREHSASPPVPPDIQNCTIPI